MIRYLTLLLSFLTPFVGFGQDFWSLERCIEQAESNSLTIKESQIDVQRSEINLKTNQLSRYPSLSGSTGINYNLGRSIDPISNAFVTTNLLSNSYGLNSSLTIYNGNRMKNTIAQSEINEQISRENLEQTRRDLALDVASAYLQILLAIEQENNAKITVEKSKQQLDRINKLIKVGSLPEGDKYEVEAQLARDEQNLVTFENSLGQTYLNLKILLQLPIDETFTIEQPNIPVPSPESLEVQPFQAIIQRAVANQPSIKAGDLQLISGDYSLEMAKAGMRPSVNLFASSGTNYSTFAQTLGGLNYFEQIGKNINGSIGISLNVPIYDKGATKSAVELAKLTQLTQQISNRRTRQNLETKVQQAFMNAKAAGKQLQAAQRTVIASQKAFDNTQKRYDLGASTLLELNTSRNNLAQSELQLIIAKYDYIFKLKILDFYQGKKITLK